MARSGKLNEFVLISRSESGAFVVVYGPRDNDRIRHSRGGFDTAEAAVAWVEMLDRHVSGDFSRHYGSSRPGTGAFHPVP